MIYMLPNACRIRFVIWAFFGIFATWSGILAVLDSTNQWFIDLRHYDSLTQWKAWGERMSTIMATITTLLKKH
jgi:hypothetical protein